MLDKKSNKIKLFLGRLCKIDTNIYKIIILVAIWIAILMALAGWSSGRLPLSASAPPSTTGIHHLLDMWVRWDAGHYKAIAEGGYTEDIQAAFFPLFPILIRYLAHLFRCSYISAGLAISYFALLGTLIYLYKLVKLDFKKDTALRAVFYLLIFPTAFFLAAMYTESLFLFTVIASFYYARKGKWLLAGIFGFFASLTRITGIVLLGALFIEYLAQRQFRWHRIKANILSLLLVPSGLATYMIYLYHRYGDALAFLHIQKFWGRGLSISTWRPFIEYAKRLIHMPVYYERYFSEAYINDLVDFLGGLAAVVLCVLLFLYIQRKSYLFYSVGVVLLPLLTGSLHSIIRYVLVVFPIFIMLALWGRARFIDRIIIISCLPLQGFLVVLFTNSYWVA